MLALVLGAADAVVGIAELAHVGVPANIAGLVRIAELIHAAGGLVGMAGAAGIAVEVETEIGAGSWGSLEYVST